MTTLSARALLFDMDGTLIDSTAAVERIWGVFADRFGLDVADILATSHGVRMVETVRQHAPEGTDAEAVTRELGAIEREDREGIVPLPGAVDFLAGLPRASVALVTSATRDLAEIRMAACGLPLPDAVVTADLVERGKPAPDPYLAAAELLGVEPADAIVLEDAEAGIRSGLAAGARVIVVGGLDAAVTAGLPRIRDYRDIAAEVAADGSVTLTLHEAVEGRRERGE
ncbi:HAD-IA family hydrolase [Galbitalea sp. SE-J8]|uniref:HAD-IA family hydrolase n=1 Tax=Galbitalea sp. SE-J8 TaxID=3054952 RepID=UPI00259CDB5C|nr:HAD-IA family hydrolase [Galbitalea sp. SE-J8]MDM4763533.1 HAD-IA family hydrolase [Galbitalea sp. SE-J8]